jgi:hypothetical protein
MILRWFGLISGGIIIDDSRRNVKLVSAKYSVKLALLPSVIATLSAWAQTNLVTLTNRLEVIPILQSATSSGPSERFPPNWRTPCAGTSMKA